MTRVIWWSYPHTVWLSEPRTSPSKPSLPFFISGTRSFTSTLRREPSKVLYSMIEPFLYFLVIVTSNCLGYISNVSWFGDLSRKKIKFFCIVDNTEVNEIPLLETSGGEVDFMLYLLPKSNSPPVHVAHHWVRLQGIAKPRTIVFY